MKEGICKIGRVKPKRSSEIKSSRIGWVLKSWIETHLTPNGYMKK